MIFADNSSSTPSSSEEPSSSVPEKTSIPAQKAQKDSGQEVPPKKGSEAPKKKSKSGLLISFIGLFLFLFVLFMAFLVVMLLQNGGNNPILGALGVEPALLKDLLQTLISLVFGFLSFVSLIVFLFFVFRRFTATKVEVEKKKRSLIFAVVSGLFFIFCVFLWIVLFFYISRLQIGGGGAAVILTDPAETLNLSAPVSITFDAQEVEQLYLREGIISYAWDLDGDGIFDDGNGRAIQYRYTDTGNNDGTYNVALKIILADGQEKVISTLVTIANVLPQPVIAYSPSILEVPLEVSFDASGSRDPDGSIIAYDWDFDGDGSTDAQGEKVDYLFSEAESVVVRLTVTDNNGEKTGIDEVLDFRKGKAKEAVIIARPSLTGEVPFQISVDGSNSYIADRIQSYEWDFGDGSPLVKGRLAQHTYEREGEYDLILVVLGQEGERYEVVETVTVQRATTVPKPEIEVKGVSLDSDGVLRGEAPLEVVLNAASSRDPDGNIIDYQWDFDDDGVTDAVGEEVTYTFVDMGLQTVSLTVIDDDELSATVVLPVEIVVPDVEVFLDVSEYSGSIPLEVTFDATASRAESGKIISYTWDFGDDSPEVIGSARQTHLYSQVGEYTVTVSVLTDDGKRGEKEVIVVAREVELQAAFTVNPPQLKAGSKVFFDASQSQGQISRYYWEFGDGQISRVVKPDHTYPEPGVYVVKLEIYDRKNRVSRYEQEITVENP